MSLEDHSYIFATHIGQKTNQLDVINTFLNGDLHEEVCVKQAPSFALKVIKPKICLLQDLFYGIMQASHTWYEKMHRHCIIFNVVYDA